MNKLINLFKNNLCFIIFLTTFTLLNLFLIISCIENNNNISNFFRIHVVAATDSIEDQKIKLEVAENVQSYISNITEDLTDKSKENLKNIVTEHIDEILNIANYTIKENGKNYSVVANIGNIYYDEKIYNGIKADSGIYDSLQIVLESGQGQNWWSLIYPYSYECCVEHADSSTDEQPITSTNLLQADDTIISFGLLELILSMFNK